VINVGEGALLIYLCCVVSTQAFNGAIKIFYHIMNGGSRYLKKKGGASKKGDLNPK
jgi:hypothetical protein